MHYFAAEKLMKDKFGETTILVKDELKIAHYIKTLGEPITTIMAESKAGQFQYAVFVRDLPCSPLPTKATVQTVAQESVAAKTTAPAYDIQTPQDMLCRVKATEGGKKYPFDHLLLKDRMWLQGGKAKSE